MNLRKIIPLCAVLAAGLLLLGVPRAAAEIRPSSDVLLPYFEVDLKNAPDPGRTTLFAICNDGEDPVNVKVSVVTNWGISVLDVDLVLMGKAVQTVNLRDWLMSGRLPGGQTLPPEKIAFLQAALTGKSSPDKHLYYATEVAPDLAVGAVRFRTQGPDVLWGDSFVADPKLGYTEGETLVNLDPGTECLPECKRHGIRFLSGGTFDAGTELMIWTDNVGLPSAVPDPPGAHKIKLDVELYDEAGRLFDTRHLKLMPLERLKVSDLGITEPFGWAELITEVNAFVTGHYSASSMYSAGLHAWCLPPKAVPPLPGPGIRIEKLTNGTPAEVPPGPIVPVGSTVEWTYIVTNTGDVRLISIVVTDSDGVAVSCPGDVLEPGESMTCTASAPAVACQHENTAGVTAVTAEGQNANDFDISHYYGEEQAGLSFAVLLNGEHTVPPGPIIETGEPVTWTYTVNNTGTVKVYSVAVSDQHGFAVSCPKTVLDPGELMTCTASGTAQTGPHSFTATAKGGPKCGPEMSLQDSSHYTGFAPRPEILIKKHTNGEDADVPTGPVLLVGARVTWTYQVTNTGNVTLTAVQVTDSKGVAVSCPKTRLVVGETMTCTASGTAVAGQYANVGTATGKPPTGANVSDTDPSHYFGAWPDIAIVKKVNGDDANTNCPNIFQGSPVQWTYLVTNTGDQTLNGVTVTDDKGVAVSCPKTVLQPGESMTCTGSGTAIAGPYSNVGTATGTANLGGTVTDNDPACYNGILPPGISIEKRVNGEDADQPTGPMVRKGSPVQWTYEVTNTGGVRLTNVTVTDDKGVHVTCPKTALDPGETMTCTASGTAISGQYKNIGTVTGKPPTGSNVSASDPAHYYGFCPGIHIEKRTNGEDADSPPGPKVPVGSTVQWTYVVKNTGDITLTQVTVTDDRGVVVTCPKTVLQPNEEMTCTGSGTAIAGQYKNVGTATGKPPSGANVSDTDPSHYYGKVYNQGCTPGYWKNHTGSWPPTGYSTGQKVVTVFGEASRYTALGNSTLLAALAFGGGSGNEGAAEILLRAAVAALLNAAHPDVWYPRTVSDVVSSVNAALASNSRDTMLALAAQLDADNNLGCPLN